MAKLSQWAPYSSYVQAGLHDGQFLNASFTLIAAGPPRLAAVAGGMTFMGTDADQQGADNVVFPIGIVQNFNLSHTRQFSRIFEIGSERSFFISGRTMGQLGLSRIVYHGPSLLRVLYAYYEDTMPPTVKSLISPTNPGWISQHVKHDVKIPAGFDNLFLNLASDLFSQPMGLMVYFRDCNEQTVGSVYMEACYIPNHTIATDAQGTIIQENAAVQFERLLPVAVTGMPVLDLAATDQEIQLGIR